MKHLPEDSDDRPNSESGFYFQCLFFLMSDHSYIVSLSFLHFFLSSLFCSLSEALGMIAAVASHINETIRQMDNFKKIVEVSKKLIGDVGDSLISPHRVRQRTSCNSFLWR